MNVVLPESLLPEWAFESFLSKARPWRCSSPTDLFFEQHDTLLKNACADKMVVRIPSPSINNRPIWDSRKEKLTNFNIKCASSSGGSWLPLDNKFIICNSADINDNITFSWSINTEGKYFPSRKPKEQLLGTVRRKTSKCWLIRKNFLEFLPPTKCLGACNF